MNTSILYALIVFGLVAMVLFVIEIILHRVFHWENKNYRLGVILFALLAAIYAYFSNVGR